MTKLSDDEILLMQELDEYAKDLEEQERECRRIMDKALSAGAITVGEHEYILNHMRLD